MSASSPTSFDIVNDEDSSVLSVTAHNEQEKQTWMNQLMKQPAPTLTKSESVTEVAAPQSGSVDLLSMDVQSAAPPAVRVEQKPEPSPVVSGEREAVKPDTTIKTSSEPAAVPMQAPHDP